MYESQNANPHQALNHPLIQALLNNCFDSAIVLDAKTREVFQAHPEAKQFLETDEETLFGRNGSEVVQTTVCAASCPLKNSAPETMVCPDTEMLYQCKPLRDDISARSRAVVVRNTQVDPGLETALSHDS
jgi:hypothetical protein